MKAWKEFEALSAKLFKSKRNWANSGEALDFEGSFGDMRADGQCKLVKQLPLNALTRLVESLQRWNDAMVISPVCVKVRRGRGVESEPLVVLSFSDFEKVIEMLDFHIKTVKMRNSSAVPDRMEGTFSE